MNVEYGPQGYPGGIGSVPIREVVFVPRDELIRLIAENEKLKADLDKAVIERDRLFSGYRRLENVLDVALTHLKSSVHTGIAIGDSLATFRAAGEFLKAQEKA